MDACHDKWLQSVTSLVLSKIVLSRQIIHHWTEFPKVLWISDEGSKKKGSERMLREFGLVLELLEVIMTKSVVLLLRRYAKLKDTWLGPKYTLNTLNTSFV